MIGGLISGLVGGVAGILTGNKQAKAAEQAQKRAEAQWGEATNWAHQGYGLAKENLAEAQNFRNARMAGGSAAEQNIFSQQAGTIGTLQKNATSAAQLLAMAGAVGNQTNDALVNLGVAEAQSKAGRQGMVMNARAGVQGAMGNIQGLSQARAAEAGAAAVANGQASQQNTFNGISSLGSTLGAGFNMLGIGKGGGAKPAGQAYPVGEIVNNPMPKINLNIPTPKYKSPFE